VQGGKDMLDEISPVQFIEGVNENEELTNGTLPEFRLYGVAIPYTPRTSYILTGIEMYISPSQLQNPKEHIVELRTDHNDNPSTICLVDGKLVVPVGIGRWVKIELLQNVAVLSGRTYWLCLPEHPLEFALGISKRGEELSLRANPEGEWLSSESDIKYRCMLRCYGTVIPVVK